MQYYFLKSKIDAYIAVEILIELLRWILLPNISYNTLAWGITFFVRSWLDRLG